MDAVYHWYVDGELVLETTDPKQAVEVDTDATIQLKVTYGEPEDGQSSQ